jgi:hypothetical protein
MPPKVPERPPVYYLVDEANDTAATGDLRRVAALENAGYRRVSISDYMEALTRRAFSRFLMKGKQ